MPGMLDLVTTDTDTSLPVCPSIGRLEKRIGATGALRPGTRSQGNGSLAGTARQCR